MKLRIRPSSLTGFADCARRWAAANLAGEIEEAGFKLKRRSTHIGAVTGTGTHAGSTWALAEKMRTGDLGGLDDAAERSVVALKQEIEKEGASWDAVTPDLNTAQQQVIRQTKSFLTHIGRDMSPIMVESRMVAERRSGAEVSGQVDIVVDNDASLNDIKTGKVTRNNAPQYGSYSRLCKAHGIPIEAIKEHWVPRVALRQQQPRPVTIAYDMAKAEVASELIMKAIERDVSQWRETGDPDAFLPNTGSVLCSDRFCPAWGTEWCPFSSK